MRRRLATRFRMAALTALGVVAVGGCATSPATRLYVLAPVVGNDSVPSSEPVELGAGMIGLRSVELPEELDRPEIVTRTGPTTVRLAEFDQWSAPLRGMVMQVIGQDLAVLLPGDRVVVYPWPRGTPVDRELIIEVTRFDGELSGRCLLEARWQVLTRPDARRVVNGRSMLNEACGPDYAALTAAESRLLGALSAELATAIRNLGLPDVTGRPTGTHPASEDRSGAGRRREVAR